ncbi:hypothetical protein, partial [uncultured Salegentibacter sp.]|uniref:hypothetical protein n=1 Tax=uncultured Salegentibacter sp. TaxID=259320 RepID=UPI0030DCECD8
RQPSKLNVAGSNPVSRSKKNLNRKVGVFLWKRIREEYHRVRSLSRLELEPAVPYNFLRHPEFISGSKL